MARALPPRGFEKEDTQKRLQWLEDKTGVRLDVIECHIVLIMVGVARDVAAITGSELRIPSVEFTSTGPDIDSLVSVEIVDADLCSRSVSYTHLTLPTILLV